MNTYPRRYHVDQAYRYLKEATPDPKIHLKIARLINRMTILHEKGRVMPYTNGTPKKARYRRKYLSYARQVMKICRYVPPGATGQLANWYKVATWRDFWQLR